MTCNFSRELISARIDGEIGQADEAHLDAHLQDCAACGVYQQDAFALRRSLRMRAVEPLSASTPDPGQQVGLVDSLRGVAALRGALFVIGATLVLLNVQAIVATDGTVTAHLNRHDGVFGTALGIGMLVVAARPQRAIGLVPLTSAIAVLMIIVATADLLTGNANLLAEAIHVVEFAGLLCLWFLSGGPTRFSRSIESLTNRRLSLASD